VSEYLVNLNALSRPILTIEVGERTFEIRRVVTGARRLWSAFVAESQGYLAKIAEFDKDRQALEAQGEKGEAEIIRLTEQISADVTAFADGKIERLFGILELLLTKNGYEFDRQWWVDNADETDYRSFILEALAKDTREGSSVKKKEGEET
jgi:hypothetical protein